MTLPIEKKIIILAQLQTYLSGVSRQKTLDKLHIKIISAIHSLMNDLVSGLEPQSLQELLDEFRTFAPEEQIAMFDLLITEDRIKDIRDLRNRAISTKQSLDLSGYYEGYEKIPLQVFSWQSKIEQLEQVIAIFKNPGSGYESFSKSSLEFFGNIYEGCLPILMPKHTDSIIQELIGKEVVSAMNATDLIDDVNRIQRLTARSSKENREKIHSGDLSAESFVQMGNDAFMFLKEYWNSAHLKNKIDICQYLALWHGPGKADFLRQLALTKPDEKHFEICLACTGVHPMKSPQDWDSGAELEIKKEHTDCKNLLKIIQDNRFIYDFLYVANFHDHSDIIQSNRWKSIFEKTRAVEKVITTPPEIPPPLKEADLSGLAQMSVNQNLSTIALKDMPVISQSKSSTDPDNDSTFVLSTDDMDFEDLSADDKHISAEDKIAQEHSTWNKYLKPFLSENLLGILGAALLMLAWLCISIWVWDKGQYYRLLAGALPMYLTSFALAFISRFFYKNLDKGVSPRAPALFAAMCVLSIPFNYLIALSMFYLGKTIGPLAGIGLGIMYGLTLIFLIGRWIKDSIGFNPGVYLTIINTILFLPAISLFMNRQMLSFSIHTILFGTFFISVYQIYATKTIEESKYRFRSLLFGSNYFLTLFICCVFYRILPDPGSIAILAQLISLFIIYLGKDNKVYKQMILTSVLSIMGILICLKSVLPLTPLCILLSGLAWIQYKKKVQSPWLDDIMVGHLFVLSGSIVFELTNFLFPGRNLLLPQIAFSAALAIVFSILYETKIAKRTMSSVSFLIPVALIFFSIALFQAPLNTLSGFFIMIVLSISGCVYGYRRYSQYYLKSLWFTNLGICLFVPALGLAAIGHPDAALMSFALVGLIWTLVSEKLKDALAHSHKTGVALMINIISTCAFITGCQIFYSTPSKIGWLMILAFICLLVSITAIARKTLSQIPIYVTFFISGMFGSIVYNMMGIQMKTGLGTGLAAVGALYCSHLLKSYRIWQADDFDTVFNQELPLRSKSYLYFPFELAGWGLTIMALIKASIYFTILNSGPHHFSIFALKILMTLIIVTSCFYYFIKKYNFAQSGYILFWPAILIVCSLSSYVLPIFRPVWLLVCLFTFDHYAGINKIKPEYENSIIVPIKRVNLILNYSTILFGFFLYIYYIALMPESFLNKYLLVTSIVMVCIYVHKTFISKSLKHYAHLIPLHLVAMILLGYALFNQETIAQSINQNFETFLSLLGTDLLKLLIVVGTILFVPGFIFEKSKNKITSRYSKVFHIWLFGTACILGIVILGLQTCHLLAPLEPDFLKTFLYITIAGYCLVHAGNRSFHSLFLYGVKSILCICTGILLLGNPLPGLLFGFVAFTTLELLLCWGMKNNITWPMAIRPGIVDHLSRLAWASEFFVYITLAVHLIIFSTALEPPNHFLLYLLIPYMVFCYRRMGKNYLGYIIAGIFTYTNVLVFFKFYPFFVQNQLNSSHLLSISAIFTIAVFLVYNKISHSFRTEATS